MKVKAKKYEYISQIDSIPDAKLCKQGTDDHCQIAEGIRNEGGYNLKVRPNNEPCVVYSLGDWRITQFLPPEAYIKTIAFDENIGGFPAGSTVVLGSVVLATPIVRRGPNKKIRSDKGMKRDKNAPRSRPSDLHRRATPLVIKKVLVDDNKQDTHEHTALD